MVRKNIILFFFIWNSGSIVFAQTDFPVLKGPYLGQKPPGLKAEIFAPGIISTEMHDDAAPVFSPDGREVYFRIVYKLEGLYYSSLFWMKRKRNRWSYPDVAPFSGKYLDGSIAIFPDGRKMIFCSNRGKADPQSYDIDLWQVEKEGVSWSEPEKIEILNSPGAEMYQCLASDQHLFWTVESGMNDPAPKTYSSRIIGSQYSQREEVRLFPDSDQLVYVFAFAPDGSYAIVLLDEEGNMGDLYVIFKESDGSWGSPINLGSGVNSMHMEKSAGISPDGRWLFFVSSSPSEHSNLQKLWDSNLFEGHEKIFSADIYWVSTGVIDKLRD